MKAALAVLFVGASLLPPHPGTILPATGLATYYNPGIFQQVVVNRERWGQVPECPECDGYAAMLLPADLGRVVCVEGLRLLVVDVAAAHHRGGLVAKGWIIDLDWPVWEALGYPRRPVTVKVEVCE